MQMANFASGTGNLRNSTGKIRVFTWACFAERFSFQCLLCNRRLISTISSTSFPGSLILLSHRASEERRARSRGCDLFVEALSLMARLGLVQTKRNKSRFLR